MSFPEDFVERVGQLAALEALVGDRIYPGGIPQEPQLPSVSFRTQSGEANARLASPGPVAKLMVEVTAYGRTIKEAYEVVVALRTAMENPAENPHPGAITGVVRQSWEDGYVPEVRSFIVVQRYSLFHKE